MSTRINAMYSEQSDIVYSNSLLEKARENRRSVVTSNSKNLVPSPSNSKILDRTQSGVLQQVNRIFSRFSVEN